jgi:hypothetical protein
VLDRDFRISGRLLLASAVNNSWLAKTGHLIFGAKPSFSFVKSEKNLLSKKNVFGSVRRQCTVLVRGQTVFAP